MFESPWPWCPAPWAYTTLPVSFPFFFFFNGDWRLETFTCSLTAVNVLNILATTQRAALSEMCKCSQIRVYERMWPPVEMIVVFLCVWLWFIFDMLLSLTAPKTFPETVKQSEQQQAAETTSAAPVHSVKSSNLQSSTICPTEALKGKLVLFIHIYGRILGPGVRKRMRGGRFIFHYPEKSWNVENTVDILRQHQHAFCRWIGETVSQSQF